MNAMIVPLIRRLVAGLRAHSASLASLGVRAGGVGLAFVVSLLIGRLYGPAAYGQYALVTQTGMFLSIVAIGGFEVAVVREFSRAITLDIPVSRASVLKVIGQAMGVTLAIIALLAPLGDDLLDLLGHEEVSRIAVIALCAIVLSRAFSRVTAAILRARRGYVLSQTVELLLIPVFTLGFIGAGLVRDIDDALWATALAGLITAAIGLVSVLRGTSAKPEALQVSSRALYAVALPLWAEAITLSLTEWYSLAVVSATSGSYDAGLFRIAVQFASVISIVTMGLLGTFVPQISAAVHGGDMRKVAALAGSATRLSAVLILPGAFIVLAFAEPLLNFILPEFAAATGVLRVLVVGNVILSVVGIWAGQVLALTGSPKVNLLISATSAAIMLIGMPWIAQNGGIMGAGLFVSVALIGRTIACVIAVRRTVGVDVLFGRVVVPANSGSETKS